MRPNVLFLFPDQLRWDWIGCAGRVPVRTPNIDGLAARGVRFERVWCNSPVCAPSRACLTRGLRYHRAGVRNNGDDLDLHAATYLQRLREAGYRVGTVGKCDLHKGSCDFAASGWTPRLERYGFTDAVDQGGKWASHGQLSAGDPEPYTRSLVAAGLGSALREDFDRRRRMRGSLRGPWHDTAPSPLPRHHYTDDFCGRSGLTVLERLPDDSPWFLWVNFPGPHEPFDPPAELRDRYAGVDFPPPAAPDLHRPEDHNQIRRNYAAMIEGIDEWIGRLLAAVTGRGESERTVVVFASDHGEMLGDRGRWYKAVPWEASVRVPLILAGPGIPPGRTTQVLAELIDVAATVLDLAGVDGIPCWDARSLLPAAHGAARHRQAQFAALEDWRAVHDGRHKLIDYQDGRRSLYDLRADPEEQDDLAPRDGHAGTVDRLAALLQRESPWPEAAGGALPR